MCYVADCGFSLPPKEKKKKKKEEIGTLAVSPSPPKEKKKKKEEIATLFKQHNGLTSPF